MTATTASIDIASEQVKEIENKQFILVEEDNIYSVNEECMDTDAEKILCILFLKLIRRLT